MTVYQSESETINRLMSNNGTCGTLALFTRCVYYNLNINVTKYNSILYIIL